MSRHGRVRGRTWAAACLVVLAVASTARADSQQGYVPALAATSPTDAQTINLLIGRMSFADKVAAYPLSDLQTAGADIADHFAQMSNGRIHVNVTVIDVPLSTNFVATNADCPMGRTCAQSDLRRNALLSAARQTGTDLSSYDATTFVQPDCVGASGGLFRGVTEPNRARFTGTFTGGRLNANVTTSWVLPCNPNAAAPRPFFSPDWTHEFGHQMQLLIGNGWDDRWFGHPSGYSSGYDLMDSCYPCASSLFGITDAPIQTSRWNEFPDFLSVSKVVTVDAPASGTSGQTVVLSPLSDSEADTTSPQGIKIPIDDNRYYLVEARRKTGIDAPIPDTRGGVVINRVDNGAGVPVHNIDSCDTVVAGGCARGGTGDPRLSSCTGPITFPSSPAYCWPYPLWQPGNVYTDTANNIEIRIDDNTGDGAVVTVTRGPIHTRPDVMLIPWLTPPMNTYETTDIWVDSSCNGFETNVGVAGLRYGRRADGTVIGNGDDPCANHVNRIYAVVRNRGTAPANNVVVHFKVSNPLGVGVRGPDSFVDVGSADSATFPALGSIPAGGTATVYVPWTPSVARSGTGTFAFHSCVQVTIDPVANEAVLTNQDGDGEQENFDTFEMVRDPATTTIPPVVHNFHLTADGIPGDPAPSNRTTFTFGTQGSLPHGWTLQLNQGKPSMTLPRKSTVDIPVKVSAPAGAPVGQSYTFDVMAYTHTRLVNLSAPPGERHHDATAILAGIAYSATVVKRTTMQIAATRISTNDITVTGVLDPAIAGTWVDVDVTRHTSSGDETQSLQAKTNSNGKFSVEFKKAYADAVDVQGIFQGTQTQSEAVSDIQSLSAG